MTSDGFYKSGDVGYYVKDQLFFVDRKVSGTLRDLRLPLDSSAGTDRFHLWRPAERVDQVQGIPVSPVA